MNNPRLKSIFVLAALMAIVAGISLYVSARSQKLRSSSNASPHFLGGVVVIFKERVPSTRVDEIIASVSGTVIFRNQTLHEVVARFNPPISLKQAENVGEQLRTMPDVQSAGPEFEVPAD